MINSPMNLIAKCNANISNIKLVWEINSSKTSNKTAFAKKAVLS